VGEASGLEAADEKHCPPAHNAPYFARNATPYATNSDSQAIIKSLQFESVSMKTVDDAKKDAAVRFLDRLRAFRGSMQANSLRSGGGNRTVRPAMKRFTSRAVRRCSAI
jgi:hypothetical protein